MKIAIIGYSGSGKSTLARKLGEKYGIDVLHIDSIQFLPGWAERELDEKQKLMSAFLDSHDEWVIDGTYSKLSFERRVREADMIIVMNFNRFACLLRGFRRYCKYKNSTRPDMAEGCDEKFDAKFVSWILWDGRRKSKREIFARVIAENRDKTVVIGNQRQLEKFEKENGLEK